MQPTSLLLPASSLRCGQALGEKDFSLIHRRMLLDGNKWDAQVGDVSTLAPFPLIMKSGDWQTLASQAEQLATEALTAEYEILQHPALLNKLGLPHALQRALSVANPPSPAAPRILRFDFHPTLNGWKISEVNSDVPGGFTESSFFAKLMADAFPHLKTSGIPAAAWCQSLTKAAGTGGTVALIAAPGYMEDQQVVSHLAKQLRDFGCRAIITPLTNLAWNDGKAIVASSGCRFSVDLIVRFYQAEWLSRLPVETGWQNLFHGSRTQIANPGVAAILESKRFPLVWDELSTPLNTWRALLPETRDPRAVSWRSDSNWLLKTAFCNNGDTISVRNWVSKSRWFQTRWRVLLHPGNWIAQRRFESVPIDTPYGLRHVCIGIYVLEGRAIGTYARLAAKPWIDFEAADAALLLADDD